MGVGVWGGLRVVWLRGLVFLGGFGRWGWFGPWGWGFGARLQGFRGVGCDRFGGGGKVVVWNARGLVGGPLGLVWGVCSSDSCYGRLRAE